MNTRQIKITPIAFSMVASMLVGAFLPTLSMGGGLRQFAMFSSPEMAQESCALVERYSKKKKASMKFQGAMDDYACNVSIPKEKYEQLFQFCYQSGINVKKINEENSLECFIQERDNDYLFLAHISPKSGKDSQVMCYFSCIAK